MLSSFMFPCAYMKIRSTHIQQRHEAFTPRGASNHVLTAEMLQNLAMIGLSYSLFLLGGVLDLLHGRHPAVTGLSSVSGIVCSIPLC